MSERAIAATHLLYTRTFESALNGMAARTGASFPLTEPFGGTVREGRFSHKGLLQNSFRLPTFNDLYIPRWVRDLLPEDAHQFNVGIAYAAVPRTAARE